MSKAVAKVWNFPSSSGRGSYETLQYADGTTSCNCPGWTRRMDPTGNRSCKHTRSVDMGTADRDCDSMHDYQTAPAAPVRPSLATANVAPLRKDASFGARGRKLAI
jgi:hypothetical protein